MSPSIAYFSMEIGLVAGMPTYAGGLGALAGDTLQSAADLGLPLAAVTLVHRRGYFFQRLSPSGQQTEEPVKWRLDDFLQPSHLETEIIIEGRRVRIGAWKRDVVGRNGHAIPVYFLDTDHPENSDWDRQLTDSLYGGDDWYRLCQEIVLGIGGVRLLRAAGYAGIRRFHLNEGHAALLTLELLREHRLRDPSTQPRGDDLEHVRRQCVFTTHTPVPAGHDQYPLEMVDRALGNRREYGLGDSLCHDGRLNMTYLALSLSHYVNGVAKRHGEVSQQSFHGYKIDAITNGVNAERWVCPAFAAVFDKSIPGWREDNFSLRYAISLPIGEIRAAHRQAKRQLLATVNALTNSGLDEDLLTIGFARRITAYKRPDLLFDDLDRLRRISSQVGKLQIICAGKAHPRDRDGKQLIERIFAVQRQLAPDVSIAFVPGYDLNLARQLTAGVDLWLNTPQPPLEASGTSGMKAALNGVPSLSVLDGWWIEGCIEGITGWAIGEDGVPNRTSHMRADDAAALYEKLEQICTLYETNNDGYVEVMRHAIALNGSFFNTQRMIQQYVLKAYF